MGLFIAFVIGAAVGYAVKAIGVKMLIADLKAEVARLRNKEN